MGTPQKNADTLQITFYSISLRLITDMPQLIFDLYGVMDTLLLIMESIFILIFTIYFTLVCTNILSFTSSIRDYSRTFLSNLTLKLYSPICHHPVNLNMNLLVLTSSFKIHVLTRQNSQCSNKPAAICFRYFS